MSSPGPAWSGQGSDRFITTSGSARSGRAGRSRSWRPAPGPLLSRCRGPARHRASSAPSRNPNHTSQSGRSHGGIRPVPCMWDAPSGAWLAARCWIRRRSGGLLGWSMGVQGAAVGCGGANGAVGVAGDCPAPSVDDGEVVEAAEQAEVGQAGGAAVGPGDEVVHVADRGRLGAARKLTMPVPLDDGGAQVGWDGAGGAARSRGWLGVLNGAPSRIPRSWEASPPGPDRRSRLQRRY